MLDQWLHLILKVSSNKDHSVILHASVTGPGPRCAKQAECLRPLAPIHTKGGGPGGVPQGCLVNVSGLLQSLLCWKAFLIP